MPGVVVPGRSRTSQITGYHIGEKYLQYLEVAFDKADADGSGSLSAQEIQEMWRYVFSEHAAKDVMRMTDDIHQDLDPNRDGQVSWPEMESFFKGQASIPNEIDALIEPRVCHRDPTVREIIWRVVEIDAPFYTTGMPCWVSTVRPVVGLLTNTAIMVSILNFVLESLPSQQKEFPGDEYTSWQFILEAVCIAIFTVEFCVRASSCPSYPDFVSSFFTWIDIMAIAPFFIGVGLGNNPSGGLLVLRVLRLLRLVRMLKLGRSLETVQVLVISVHRVLNPLMVAMLGVNSIAVVLFASLMYTVELDEASFDHLHKRWVRDRNSTYVDAGEVTFFQSIPHSMWWAWVTLTTVGYGDTYPVTGAGKAIASITMVCGLVVMAFPLTLLANSFGVALNELQTKKNAQSRGLTFMEHLAQHACLPEELRSHITSGFATIGERVDEAGQEGRPSQITLQGVQTNCDGDGSGEGKGTENRVAPHVAPGSSWDQHLAGQAALVRTERMPSIGDVIEEQRRQRDILQQQGEVLQRLSRDVGHVAAAVQALAAAAGPAAPASNAHPPPPLPGVPPPHPPSAAEATRSPEKVYAPGTAPQPQPSGHSGRRRRRSKEGPTA